MHNWPTLTNPRWTESFYHSFKLIFQVAGHRQLNNGVETENLFCHTVIWGMTLNFSVRNIYRKKKKDGLSPEISSRLLFAFSDQSPDSSLSQILKAKVFSIYTPFVWEGTRNQAMQYKLWWHEMWPRYRLHHIVFINIMDRWRWSC